MTPDARTFTFWLRKGVQWQRGYGEVTSDDVAFTLARMKDPKTGTAYSANYRQIESVETPDRYTIVVHLSVPNPFFHAIALMPRFGGYIVCKKAVEELGDKYRHNPVGAGAFSFASYEPKQKVVLRANEQYWGVQAKDRHARSPVPAGNRRSHIGFREGRRRYDRGRDRARLAARIAKADAGSGGGFPAGLGAVFGGASGT